MRRPVVASTTTDRGYELVIEEYADQSTTLYCLDCGSGSYGKAFDELPRFYRTERGCKNAAARLVIEKLKWVKP